MTGPLKVFTRHITMTSSVILQVEVEAQSADEAEDIIRFRASDGIYDSVVQQAHEQSRYWNLTDIWSEEDDANGEELADVQEDDEP